MSGLQTVGRGFILPVLALVLVGAVALGAGYLTAGERDPRVPPAKASPPGPTVVRGTLQGVSGDAVTLATDAGPQTLRLTPGAHLEALRRISLDQVRPGDWANAGGVPHAQTLFALVGVVVIPEPLLGGAP